jgi:hypothetical protein
MKPTAQLFLAAAVLTAGFIVSGLVTTAPADVDPPTPLVATGPDMLAVFAVNADRKQAAADATQFAAICWHCSDCVLFDGTRGESALLKSGLDLARYRGNIRLYTTQGLSFATRYPTLREVVGTFLDAHAGDDADELTEAERKAWSQAFADIAQNSQYAAEHL